MKARHAAYFGYLVVRRIARWKYRDSSAKQSRLLVWPPITGTEELADVLDWLGWYIPPGTGLNVTVVAAPDIVRVAERKEWKEQQNISVVSRLGDRGFETILIRRDTLRNCIRATARFNARVECIDRHFFGVHESLAFERIFGKHETAPIGKLRDKLRQVSESNYRMVYGRYRGCRRSFVLATGPSIGKVFDIGPSPDDLVIACNSLVRNSRVLAYARPALLAFADPVFHFGRSAYARQFRQHVLGYVSRNDCFCVVPPGRALLLALHFPALVPKMIVMPIGRRLNFPVPGNMAVQAKDNIMTLYMLPIASALAKEVYVLGADGRAVTDSYFWQHDPESQYGELYASALDAHPSFFRDRDYGAYFRRHCATMEALVRHGERRGIRYCSLSRSTVPALQARFSEAVSSQVSTECGGHGGVARRTGGM